MSRFSGSLVGRGLLFTALGGWFFLTLLGQDPRRKFQGTLKLDPSGEFIPDWRFFAPRPGMHDYHLLFRDELPDGEVTAWKQISEIERRHPRHLLWYANRRAEKVLADSVVGIVSFNMLEERNKEDIQLTVPYLTLLNYVTHQIPHADDARRTQFLIAASGGYDESEEPLILFLSNLHPIR
jgi:hypothetical protein